MMNYEIFKEVVAEKFMDYLPEQFQHMTVKVETVNKVNKKLDGITLVSNGEGKKVSPTLYINHMYENYLSSENLQEVLQHAASAMVKAFSEIPAVGAYDFENARITLFFKW